MCSLKPYPPKKYLKKNYKKNEEKKNNEKARWCYFWQEKELWIEEIELSTENQAFPFELLIETRNY